MIWNHGFTVLWITFIGQQHPQFLGMDNSWLQSGSQWQTMFKMSTQDMGVYLTSVVMVCFKEMTRRKSGYPNASSVCVTSLSFIEPSDIILVHAKLWSYHNGNISGSDVATKFEKFVLDPTRAKDVEKLSRKYQTSILEAFHSLINQFAPKMFIFSHGGMISRYFQIYM